MKKIGYVIANEKEEYLASLKEDEIKRLIRWTDTPELALRFRTKNHAEKAIASLTDKMVWVLELMETKKQLAVGTQAEDRPPWLIEIER